MNDTRSQLKSKDQSEIFPDYFSVIELKPSKIEITET
ncbi:hypothetical protein VME0621_02081 [Vibrio mediterranei]|nr:hypothetical protein VME0621_02081 [Vibrio mediterranei]